MGIDHGDCETAAEHLTEHFGAGWTRKNIDTLKKEAAALPKRDDQADARWAIRMLEKMGEPALKAAAPKKSKAKK